MRILHLSDTHLYDPGKPREERLHYGRIDPLAAFDAVLERVAAIGPVDAIVHSGDVSDDGSAGSYSVAMERLDACAHAHAHTHSGEVPPVIVAMGNHDAPEAYARVTGQKYEDRGDLDAVIPVPGGGRVIVMNTSVPGAGWGTLSAAQLDWLDRVLAGEVSASSGAGMGPTVLVMHHPPLTVSSRLFQALSLGSITHGFGEARCSTVPVADANAGGEKFVDGREFAQRFADIVRGRVSAVLSGHLHHAVSGEAGDVPVYVAPGVANVVDALSSAGGGDGDVERAWPLSGAAIVDVDFGGAVSHISSHWWNAGDGRGSGACNEAVYEYDSTVVRRIVAAAGRGFE